MTSLVYAKRFLRCYWVIYSRLFLPVVIAIFAFQIVFRFHEFDGYENIAPRFMNALIHMLLYPPALMVMLVISSIVLSPKARTSGVNLIDHFLHVVENFTEKYLKSL